MLFMGWRWTRAFSQMITRSPGYRDTGPTLFVMAADTDATNMAVAAQGGAHRST
jgi:Mn2+/Fe2+ NRAMP family transporter